jgi:hypothetical protein
VNGFRERCREIASARQNIDDVEAFRRDRDTEIANATRDRSGDGVRDMQRFTVILGAVIKEQTLSEAGLDVAKLGCRDIGDTDRI